MSTETTATALKMSRVIKATPEAVFNAWTDPKQMKQWAAPEGVTVEIADVDLKVGGKYHIRMHAPDDVIFNVGGTYKQIDRPNRLAYTWQWEEKEHDCGETLVTVEFNEMGGSTEIVLTHEKFPNAEATGAHEQGWTSCLVRFEGLFD